MKIGHGIGAGALAEKGGIKKKLEGVAMQKGADPNKDFTRFPALRLLVLEECDKLEVDPLAWFICVCNFAVHVHAMYFTDLRAGAAHHRAGASLRRAEELGPPEHPVALGSSAAVPHSAVVSRATSRVHRADRLSVAPPARHPHFLDPLPLRQGPRVLHHRLQGTSEPSAGGVLFYCLCVARLTRKQNWTAINFATLLLNGGLDLSATPFSDADFARLSTLCLSQLTRVNLSSCGFVSAVSIAHLLSACPSLSAVRFVDDLPRMTILPFLGPVSSFAVLPSGRVLVCGKEGNFKVFYARNSAKYV